MRDSLRAVHNCDLYKVNSITIVVHEATTTVPKTHIHNHRIQLHHHLTDRSEEPQPRATIPPPQNQHQFAAERCYNDAHIAACDSLSVAHSGDGFNAAGRHPQVKERRE
ncbi:Hypothetical predicted protein [Olea europaea subsp. europaea]|uniref:Uncharacterized protein n=1 Tax=Olea europaea subsp. europaea TaxID=158383 RepID=A0A8S0V4G4_OLEEU|nr:Hypothetical predicted protein [Olea europaea subsp. europaea]